MSAPMTVRIDMAKLKAAATKRKVTLGEIGIALGHDRSYLPSTYKKGNRLPISTAILMEKLYDMERSEYEYEPPKPKETEAPQEKKKKPLTMDDLYLSLIHI